MTSRPERFRLDRVQAARRFIRRLLVAATNHDVSFGTVPACTIDLARLERERGIPLLVPDGGDPNDPRFVAQVSRELRPHVALSFECLSLFRGPLLSVFEQAVNYHSGLIPRYRGVMATSFSVFAGETESGFTFHRMTERVDDGPILAQGSVPVAGATAADVELRKLDRAIASLPRVLDAIVANEPGVPPVGRERPFRVHDWMALIRVEHPEYTTAAHLRQRIRAFGVVNLTIEGLEHPVTRLRPARPGQAGAFVTADGQLLAPDRFAGLPRLLYRLSFGSARYWRRSQLP
ncbi:MAG TPA: formyltransferase family protein [Candidatus Polarisedimenticolaceae bacterium]|nr:formyltransferase family protein [Candidatus Polarisedimenticolaceae bacterium]